MNNQLEVAGTLVKTLPSRYGIGRTILYERLNALGIVPEKQGKIGYITNEQLDLLDKLNAHIKAGKNTPDFLRQHGLERVLKQSSISMEYDNSLNGVAIATPLQELASQLEQPDSTAALLAQAATIFFQEAALYIPCLLRPADSLTNYRMLSEIAEKGWAVPTSQVRSLLGLRSLPRLDDHNRFHRKGFTFTRLSKAGREFEWRVRKTEY